MWYTFLFFVVVCGDHFVFSEFRDYYQSSSVATPFIAGGDEDPPFTWPSAAIVRSFAPFPNCKNRRCGVCTGPSLKYFFSCQLYIYL